MMHYVGVIELASPPPHEPYNTCVSSLGINFPLVKFYLYLPKVCTHRDECKSCKKRGCGFTKCCRGRLILSPTPVSLFLPFYISSLSLLSPLPRSWSKESADTSAAARPPLSALFYFSWGGLVQRTRETEREGVNAEKLQCPSSPRLFSLTSTSCPFLSHPSDLHSSPSFPFNSSFFSLLLFLSLPVLPCR